VSIWRCPSPEHFKLWPQVGCLLCEWCI